MSTSHCLFSRAATPLRFATRNCRSHIPAYNQIDYITVSQRYKTSVKDAQSWAGCTLPSDHRLVTMDLLAPKQHGYRRRNTNKLTIDTDNLILYRDLQKEFADAVGLKLPAVPLNKLSRNEFTVKQFFRRLQERRLDYNCTGDRED